MRRIIVVSHRRDLHADAILWGLRTGGQEAALWQPHHFPADAALSMRFGQDEAVRHDIEPGGAGGAGGSRGADWAGAKTVWNRRPLPPRLPADLDPRDRLFAEAESAQHLAGFLSTAWSDALWVNPPAATAFDTNKPLQLRLAQEAGFRIPATLFSNSPAEIRAFFDAHDGNIVYKSYRQESWSGEPEQPGTFVNHTAAVSREDLADERMLARCPGIFQERLTPAYELRVTAMGDQFFCVRIDVSEDARHVPDWRGDKLGLRLSIHAMSESLRDLCRAYMAKAGIVFGCFDFIVTPSGQTCFLEVNPMGQFLWKELHLPELPMLDAMCAFLASSDPRFVHDGRGERLAFSDYLDWRQVPGREAAKARTEQGTAG
jgi:hypothetical protein